MSVELNKKIDKALLNTSRIVNDTNDNPDTIYNNLLTRPKSNPTLAPSYGDTVPTSPTHDCHIASCAQCNPSHNDNDGPDIYKLDPGFLDSGSASIDPDREKDLASAINNFNVSGNYDDFNKFNPIRAGLQGAERANYDHIAKELENILRPQIKMAGSAFKLENDTDITKLINDLDTGSDVANKGLVALMAQRLTAMFYKQPEILNQLASPDNDVRILIAKNESNNGVIGFFLPQEDVQGSNLEGKRVIVLDQDYLLKALADKPDIEDQRSDMLNVWNHEFAHFVDDLVDGVNGFQFNWDDGKKAEWKRLLDTAVLDRYNDPGKFDRNFKYGLSANSAEGYAAMNELFDADPVTFKRLLPELYAFLVGEKGFDPVVLLAVSN